MEKQEWAAPENRLADNERNIHMIWFGEPFDQQPPKGTIDAPESYIENLKTIATKNPSYQVFLWTDAKSLHLSQKELPNNLKILDFDTEVPKLIGNQEKALLEKINILRGKPGDDAHNYAAACDIAKALILYKQGDIYLDTDTSFLRSFPEDLALPNNICLGTGNEEDYKKFGGQTLSNDVIAAEKGSSELRLYLDLINTYMDQEDMDIMKLPKGKILSIKENRRIVTERFGPKLMRFCVMSSVMTNDPYEFISRFVKNSPSFLNKTGKEKFGFIDSLSKLQNHLSKGKLLENIYQKYMFPPGYTKRGNAHLWLETIPTEKTPPTGYSDPDESSGLSQASTGSSSSQIKLTELQEHGD